MAGFTRLNSVKSADNRSPAGQLGAERHRPRTLNPIFTREFPVSAEKTLHRRRAFVRRLPDQNTWRRLAPRVMMSSQSRSASKLVNTPPDHCSLPVTRTQHAVRIAVAGFLEVEFVICGGIRHVGLGVVGEFDAKAQLAQGGGVRADGGEPSLAV